MEFAPAGVELSFEVTFDSPSLPFAMTVYDNTGASPIIVQGPAAMTSFVGNSYQGKFTGAAGKTYLIFKAVYTDGSFTTLDSDYAAGTESIRCDTLSSGTPVTDLIGSVASLQEIVGEIESGLIITGSVGYDEILNGNVER